ncbi:cytochrome b-c1 complex subunit 6-like isoform X2 [Notolabrus celidotus]|uniref:cytochrome b-c1 complex subunit 6-like isoform X2 n=1 Tax=Notolabrus celidotus TaxID=1203425 RepID=UPI00148FD226|nr:cytochrome b-c1 complex subunit 6-like isoform X2 [Notolabrus celidotus]
MGKKKSTSEADAAAEPTRKSPRFQKTTAAPLPKKKKETPKSKKVVAPKVVEKEEEPQEDTVEAPTENGEADSKEVASEDEAPKKEEEAEETENGDNEENEENEEEEKAAE